MSKTCQKCNHENINEAIFCAECGEKVKDKNKQNFMLKIYFFIFMILPLCLIILKLSY